MKIPPKEIKRRMDRFIEVCRDLNVRLTHQRIEIFREIAQTSDHPDAEAVYQGVRERMPTVSLDTVYRTLWWLKELGLINNLGPPRERTRFDANLDNHHHFVCTKCCLTRDFYSEELSRLKIKEMVETIGSARTMQIEVKGVCLECAAGRNHPDETSQPKK